jgi:hypothetical protein
MMRRTSPLRSSQLTEHDDTSVKERDARFLATSVAPERSAADAPWSFCIAVLMVTEQFVAQALAEVGHAGVEPREVALQDGRRHRAGLRRRLQGHRHQRLHVHLPRPGAPAILAPCFGAADAISVWMS